MGASITLAGESLIAQKQGNGQILDVTQIIFAYVPGLDTTLPVDRAAGFPEADDIVHTMAVTRKGYLSPNQVVYSALLGSDIGDFDFNWISLSTAEGIPLITAYVPTQQKRREIPPLQTGNNLTRNIVLEYDGARSLTGITVPASTWQFDFSTEFASIRKDIADIKIALANPASAVSLDGPVLIYPNSVNTYKITDYNRFSVFSATTSVGTVTISGDTLTLNIPTGAATGVVTLEVVRDGVKAPFKVALGTSAIGTPTITSPENQAVGVPLAVTLTTSAFVAYPAAADVHQSTDWRIKNAAGAVVWQSLADAANKTSITLPANTLQPGIQYFPEARHNGATLGSSQFSPATKFTTSAVSITTPTILSPINGATGIEETPTFLLSAFATVPAASDTHKSTSWRLRNALGDVIWSSTEDTVNLTQLKLPAGLLVPNKNHTIEFQYNGATLPSTPWQSSGFVTKAAFEYGKYLAVATDASPFISIYGQDIDSFIKLGNPDVLPAGAGNGVTFSADGMYAVVTHDVTPFMTVYKRSGDKFVKLANPAVIPSYATSPCFSADGKYLLVGLGLAPYMRVYKLNGDTLTALADPSNLPTREVQATAISADGVYLAVGNNQSTGTLGIYKRSGDTLTRLANPDSSKFGGNVAALSFNRAGTQLAVGLAVATTSALYLYSRSGDTFAQQTVPADYPTTVRGLAFSQDGMYLAVATAGGAPFMVFKSSSGALVRLADPSAQPMTSSGKSVAFSNDGNYVALGTGYTPFVYVYKRSGDVFSKLANPASLPPGAVNGVAFYPNALGMSA